MIPVLIAKLHRKYHKSKHKVWLLGCVISITLFSIYYILYAKPFHPKTTKLLDKVRNGRYPSVVTLDNKEISFSDKILCYIPISREKLHVAKLIKETWGSKCDELVFFGNFDPNLIPSKYQKLALNIEQLNITRDRYEVLWGKTKATLVQLNRKYGNKFQWFFKADDDTFVILENLKSFIQRLTKDEDKTKNPLWFGYKMHHNKMKHGYMSGGAGYAMNAHALSKFASFVEANKRQDFVQYDPSTMERPEGCKTATNEGIEDLELGRCFHSLKILDVPTQDNLGRHRFLPLSVSTLMSGNVHSSHWIWSQSWHPLTLGIQCCSPNLISIHEVHPAEIRLMYFLLYKLQVE